MADANDDSRAGAANEGQIADPVALSLALGMAGHDAHTAAEAAAYLKTQRRLADLQCEYITDKEHFEVSHLRWRRFTEQMKGALQVMTAVMGLAVAAALGLMVWQASKSNGLLIESFSVPPDLAARGITGQVVASQVLDKLTAMQTATQSYRAPQTYANNWGNDIKVEIPETGVSIGDIRRYLREWLGTDTHISGEVFRTPAGLAVTARFGAESGGTFTGPDADLDALIQKAAEHVYAGTQPYRYANYIRGLGRLDEARAIYLRLTDSPSPPERAWAWYGIGVLYGTLQGNWRAALWAYHKAIANNPDLTIAHSGIASNEMALGHYEAALAAFRRAAELLARRSIPDIAPRSVAYVRLQWTQSLPFLLGDFGEAARLDRMGGDMPDQQGFRGLFRSNEARALARLHDGAAARIALGEIPAPRAFSGTIGRATTMMDIPIVLEDWQGAVKAEANAEQILAGLRGHVDSPVILGVQLRPWLALAKAKLGDVTEAQRLIAATPGDCDDCLLVRAQIAAMAANPGGADYWFARAEKQAPSIPFADALWGRALLDRGQPDAAIAKFTLAHEKGPKFADPLEGWGEALMAKNQSKLAVEKFEEANGNAPNWGRLHLKWGKALVYAGRAEEAKTQFVRAAQLDLTRAEKAELAGVH